MRAPSVTQGAGAPSFVLAAHAVDLGFPGKPLLQGWSQHLPAGLVLVLGDEGAGKTSVLRLLAGEIVPAAGRLQLNGLAHGSPGYRQQVFWRDPRDAWPRDMTPVTWSMALAAQYPRWSAPAWQRHVQGFALQPHLDKAMFQLSTGSQRKVLLAAALASGAPLTLIDEPVAALDRASIGYLRAALQDCATAEAGHAVVVGHYDDLDGLPWLCTVALDTH
ncbi:MAG TPA: ABC transporter ATP-binding protein [Comamonadaceae bacterium]|uniref:ABC transporter ATP-binding protein n=1 Tax=Pulveribacter sp. TaxID=2678893 RepID=UPI000ED4EF26|nr:ATP-binding cassette domain-containing protein [Pulveribacter sp.]HCL87746.1 ABC transporter ATP-binding protein [Comamonadaceae bacterium]